MTSSANLGFPCIGAHRELKKATEAYWKGENDPAALRAVGAELRARHWKIQQAAGIDVIPSSDFSFYDHMLDMTVTLGAIPPRFAAGGEFDLGSYFAMARGTDDAPAMEMTKWFDTNYHYIVPEFHAKQTFALNAAKTVGEFNEAKALGIHTRPVIVGPVTYLLLGKAKEPGFKPIHLLDQVLPIYRGLLTELKNAGADWVQIDEPILALDLDDAQRDAFAAAYATLSRAGVKIMLATYFGGLGDNLQCAASLPVDGLHIDLSRAPEALDATLSVLASDKTLSLGLIDGRNVWRADLAERFSFIEKALAAREPALLQIAPSCSLLHTPVDLDLETRLDPELKSWLAFARQKLDEVAILAAAADDLRYAAADAFAASSETAKSRAASPRVRNEMVRARAARVADANLRRKSPFAVRRDAQRTRLRLPAFPTTTIGSFPQTAEVRKTRAAFRRGDIDEAAYEAFLRNETEKTVRKQEALGLDVLVHGEYERNDMVEYFGEQLNGFVFTQAGWVQSYGTRNVKPPIIYGDVSRPEPMTVKWSAYAQSLTDRPMKAMLTGPVTILQWSFVRDDQPRAETARQIALAIRDEVDDLERAGLPIIQIDEPALREGLPLRSADHETYLRWAINSFRLAASGAADETQIHTHMCYSEFNDIMPAVAALDADVISIETSRSDMELLDAFADFNYPNEIGPGLWDIHSPRVPSAEEMEFLLRKAAAVVAPGQLWVNPDCGLKTRDWKEVQPALANMVDAARRMRSFL